MEGFAEKGVPEDWDTALGTVRGFRVWTMRLPLHPLNGYYHGSYAGWGRNQSILSSYLPYIPGVSIEGLYGGRWNQYRQREGWYHASCQKIHRPPDPSCGCGYWAHWNGRDGEKSSSQRPWIKKTPRGYDTVIPLSGVIDGSGATIIGEQGFRTERARITDLALAVEGAGVTFEDETSRTDLNEGELGVSDFIYCSFHNDYPVTYPQSAARFLAEKLSVPEFAVTETIRAVAEHILGTSFRWHDSPADLAEACPPDENYGG